MRMMQMLWLCGPLLVRDLVLGSSGVAGALIAFIAGCAFVSAGSFAWFGYWGLLGALSLHLSIPQMRRAGALLEPAAEGDPLPPSLSVAA